MRILSTYSQENDRHTSAVAISNGLYVSDVLELMTNFLLVTEECLINSGSSEIFASVNLQLSSRGKMKILL
jgi:hypothetical protein